MSRWLRARCAQSQRAWGSEKSLYHDYRAWCQKYNQPASSRELFCSILGESFPRDAEGWQGLYLAEDRAARMDIGSKSLATVTIQ